MGTHSSEKKRKRASDRHDRPSKKPTIKPTPELSVEFVRSTTGQVPIIASTPGINLPESTPLNAYAKPRQKSLKYVKNQNLSSSELLLHSSADPRFDFTAKEGEHELDRLRNHYIAVFDPQKKTLKVVESRNMIVRGFIREQTIEVEKGSDDEAPTRLAQRAALAEAFGTKQARKAVQSITENALLSNTSSAAASAAEAALLASMPQTSGTSASIEHSAQAAIQAAKPLPQPNLSATQPADVYSIESLVPNGMSTLRQIPVRDWQDLAAAGKSIITTSRFVSHRAEAVLSSGDKTQIQLLRLILVLIEFSRSLKRASGKQALDTKRLPPREDLRRILASAVESADADALDSGLVTDSFMDSLRRRFVPQGQTMSRNDITLLHTTVCAMSLHIPPASGAKWASEHELATEPSDLRDDLRLENETILKYFRELGCKVDKPKETEFVKWGIKGGKTEAALRRVARLKIPVEFPKVKKRGGGRR
ncbi:DNA-directed RNA polymerase I subunit rpa49 [Myotisia sp. PD_48]|nr:DNA-directed RNA polymerase I subunit rpa49 [Myotisia sp. PD_48]